MKYEHGGDIYRNQVKYDFSINVNPMGIPEAVKQAAIDGIALAERYPDYMGEGLLEEIRKTYNVPKDSLLLGNGAAELIYTLCRSLMPKKALTIAPTFLEYENGVKAVGGEFIYCYLDADNDFQIGESVLDSLQDDMDIFFLCNPNNPVGTLISSDLFGEICKCCKDKDILLCVDESFLPFVRKGQEKSMMQYVSNDELCKLVILRSFTKIYAMPGLRLGYICSNDKDLLGRMQLVNQPWTTSTPAQLAGTAALKEKDYIEKTYEVIDAEREYLQRELDQLILDKKQIIKRFPSETNYLMFEGTKDLYEKLLAQGFMIRDLSNMPGLKKGYYRIGVRTHKENQALIACLNRM